MRQLICILLICSLTNCGGSKSDTGETNDARSKKISKNDFGEKWPLTVDEGVVKCVDNVLVIFVANGKVYAVNGAAKNFMEERKYADIMEIWKRDPQYPDIGMDIGPVLDTGVELCK